MNIFKRKAQGLGMSDALKILTKPQRDKLLNSLPKNVELKRVWLEDISVNEKYVETKEMICFTYMLNGKEVKGSIFSGFYKRPKDSLKGR